MTLSVSKILKTTAASLAIAGFAFALPASAKIANGDKVPNLQVVDSNGTTHNLADFKGKTVVLEWFNDGCPYVKKHYGAGNMQALQKEATADGAVWLSVVSSAPGKQGYVSGDEANALIAKHDAAPTAMILDPEGVKGKTFSARTTPHMYVIDADQTMVYQGAIDSNRSANPVTIPGATNYVREALNAIKAGQPIAEADTAPYGCSVKYGS